MKKLFLLLFLAMTTSALAQKNYAEVYDYNTFVETGIKYYDEGKYAEAITYYDKISELDPKYVTAQYEKIMALIGLEKNDEARAIFEKLHKEGRMKEEPSLYVLYGSFLSDAKEYDKSESIFNEGEKYLANSTNFLYNKAILFVRMEKNQQAVDLLKKILTINPNSASAHYLLGLYCFENGKIAEGTMAFMAYLAIAPKGSKASDVITKLNKKYGENFLDKNKLEFSKSGDNFEELETILRNQLPLRNAYKVKIDIDDVIIRQVQAVAEYAQEHKSGDGFFENIYIPWLKDMTEKKQLEGYLYYMLLSLEDNLGKKLTSHTKTIADFYNNYLNKDMWNVFALRNLEHFGKVEPVVISIDNNRPFLIGKIVNGKKEGKYKVLNEYGAMIAELSIENDQLEGVQKYYNREGKLTGERTFSKGNLNGVKKEFNESGEITLLETYKDDKLDGLSYSTYPNGGKSCEGTFVNDEREGKLTCYFPDGKVKTEMNYKDGKLNGAYKVFNEAGDLVLESNYKDGNLDGPFKKYFGNKLVNIETVYADGKVQGSIKKYYVNGKLEEETFFENGKAKNAVEYYANGSKSIETVYDADENVQSYSYYNPKNELYYQEFFKDGDLKSVKQYSRNNPKPVEANISRKTFDIKSLDGKILLSGEYDKSKRNGEWKYYYSNGNLRAKREWKKGKQDGFLYEYNRNGDVEDIYFYSNDSLSGIGESYFSEKLTGVYHYAKDEKNGPFVTYYTNGSKRVEGYYTNDNLEHYRYTYWQNGAIQRKEKYDEDELVSFESFNPEGKKETEFDYRGKTGKFSYALNNGNTIHEFNLVNGKFHGRYVVKDKSGAIEIETDFVNGNRHGNYKKLSPFGTPDYENSYQSGMANGVEKTYDLVGNIRVTEESILGKEFGKVTRFYHNKSKQHEYTQLDGAIEGDYIYYNQKGEKIAVLEYLNNALISYAVLDKNGAIGAKIPIIDETVTIESKYPNGKTAMTLPIVKGGKEGKLQIFNMDGKPEMESNYKKDILNGSRIEYYPNGKIYKKENFVMNNYEGTQEYYKEDGKLLLKAEYKNDELHGKTEIYTNGVVTVTKKYDSDELVEVIK